MNNLLLSLFALLIPGFLIGCAPRTLTSSAENVHLYSSTPKSCKFMGDILNSSVHRDLFLGSSVADIQKDDINFLKNEGAKLGANVVVLVSHSSYQTKLKQFGKQPTSITVNEHSVAAKAYDCSPRLTPKSAAGTTTHVKINETLLN